MSEVEANLIFPVWLFEADSSPTSCIHTRQGKEDYDLYSPKEFK